MLQDAFWIFAVGALLLGVILGSFLNALLFRFNTGRGMGGRSRCMRCNHTLSALDLVPIFSYLYLGGRCRYCATKISMQYPLVEAAAGVLSLKIFFVAYPDVLLYALLLLIWLTILFIVVYDARHMIIPWSSSILLFCLTLAHLVFVHPTSLWNIFAGPLLALPFLLLSLVSQGRWMGWGDSGLEISLGMLLGLTPGITGLLLGVWSGAIVGIALILIARLTPRLHSHAKGEGFTIQSEIPFAPFLALGAALVFFFHVDFFSTLSLF